MNLSELLPHRLASLSTDVKFEVLATHNVATHKQASAPLHWTLATKTDTSGLVYQRLSFKDDTGKIHNIRLRDLKEASKAAIYVWKLNKQWSNDKPTLLDRLEPHLANLHPVRTIPERLEGSVTTEHGGFDWWIVEHEGKLLGSSDYSSEAKVITKVSHVTDIIEQAIVELAKTLLEIPHKTIQASPYKGSVVLVWFQPENITYFLFDADHPMVDIIAAASGLIANASKIPDDSPFWALSRFIEAQGAQYKIDSSTITGNILAIHTAGWQL